jgi:acyl-CoA reductase-like NAD-dependent aldehyde dehydrogenase
MTATTPIDWHRRADHWRPRDGLYIDGRFRPAAAGETFDAISPVDGRLLARVAAGDAADVDAAVTSARAAFARGDWSGRAPKARKAVLLRLAELIRAHGEELALTETLDMGKPIADALAVDVPSTANSIQWFGEAVDKVYGEVAPTDAATLALVTREPLGVVGAIVPWNFPMIMAAWKS